MGENTHPPPDESSDERTAHIAGDYVDGDQITGAISAEGVSGSGHQIGHRIYKDPAYPYDVRGLTNPYLGLAAFTYAERERYAGREAQIRAAVTKLTTPGDQRVVLFVTGASGSGKSSFAQAGLLPALEAYYTQRHQTVRWAVMRPSQQPLAMLGDALQQLGMPAAQPPIATLTALLQEHTPGSSINVIMLDQFEELFTQSQPIQRDDLLSWLTGLPSFGEVRTHVIATMRADYLPELFQRQHLYEVAKAGIDLRAMPATELREAIQRPLQSCYQDEGKYLEAGLLNRLTNDAAADATHLPLLQVTLEHLWDGGMLKLERYGTLTDAIQDRAEKVYAETANPDALMGIFLDLVEVSLDDDARRDVHRRRTWDELTAGRPERKQLVAELVQARLLSKDVEHRDGQEVQVVDIIHESLLTNWPRLRDAITVQRERLQRRSRFEHWLRDWEDHNFADNYLLEGVRLSEAEELAAQRDVAFQGGAAQALLTRSVAQREAVRQRRLRQVQGAALVLAILLLIAIGAGWVAWQNASESRRLLTLALATTASTWPNNEEAFVLALAAIRLDRHTPRTQELVANVIKQYTLQNIYFGHEGTVRSVAFSPDGATVLSSAMGETLWLWDVNTGEMLRTFEGHTGTVRSVAFSPDGTTVLSGATDGTLRLWDVRPLIELADEVCANRYIVSEADAAMREQFGIPADLVLCPKE